MCVHMCASCHILSLCNRMRDPVMHNGEEWMGTAYGKGTLGLTDVNQIIFQ